MVYKMRNILLLHVGHLNMYMYLTDLIKNITNLCNSLVQFQMAYKQTDGLYAYFAQKSAQDQTLKDQKSILGPGEWQRLGC